MLCYFMPFFSTKKIVYGAKLIFRLFAAFLVQPFFDRVSNKGFYLLAARQFVTIVQEFRLWCSLLDGWLTSHSLLLQNSLHVHCSLAVVHFGTHVQL